MTWKVFTAASVSLLTLVFPQNGISCGPTEDPQDYFTRFFHHGTAGDPRFRPYYYSSLMEFYTWEEDSVNSASDLITREWSDYLGTDKDNACNLVYHLSEEQFRSLLTASNNETQPADAALRALAARKSPETIRYLVLMRRSERLSQTDGWEDRQSPDSTQIERLIEEAGLGWKSSKDEFLRPRWAFQRCKLAFYSARYKDCIRWYDEGFPKATGSPVQQMALSYKAGALYRLNRKKEAAYAFAQTFMYDSRYRKSDFRGFRFSTRDENFEYTEEEDNKRRLDSAQRVFIAMGKNNREKATITALFGLNDIDPAPDHLERAWQLDPTAPLLPILAVRAINKLEEFYLTPLLQKEKGGKALYLAWDRVDDQRLTKSRQALERTAHLFDRMAADRSVSDRSLYATGSAYLSYMIRDYTQAKTRIAKARALKPGATVSDQLRILDLLVVANEAGRITPEIEARILPSVNWMMDRAKTDLEYQYFLRNFLSEILAQRYEQAGASYRAALAYGVADRRFTRETDNYYLYGSTGIDYLHQEMATPQIELLYRLMSSEKRTAWEELLVTHASFNRNDVIDMMGTTYLRDGQYTKAIEWLKKADRLDSLTAETDFVDGQWNTVNVDPFFDYLNDRDRYDKAATKPYTKLSFAQQLLGLVRQADTIRNADARSRVFYRIGSALYNISYYGNAWPLVAYDRRTTEWYQGDYELNWQKEYYGVFRARSYYQKAYDAATNKEFKAACLFMVAKCAQRQIPGVSYYDSPTDSAWAKFYQSAYFPRFQREFGTTKFFQYTYNRCSYLRDFVNRKG